MAVFHRNLHPQSTLPGKIIADAQIINGGPVVMVQVKTTQGTWAPGSGPGSIDLYAIDAYPLRYDCGHPDIWPIYRFPRDWHKMHVKHSPDTPFFVVEF
ncbi:hypothetical protein N0V85_004991 [Neurospora sp. IMI 360204]|nr:hypothetical protein N0V85_004991 [Neurospora sp. IMI 360204]